MKAHPLSMEDPGEPTQMSTYEVRGIGVTLAFKNNLPVVRSQMTACAAVLQQACGHDVCRSHAHCAVQVNDLIVWHPDNCVVCYGLVSTLTADSSSQSSKTSALATLKIWVGGFARNVKAKKSYILSEEMCALIYPNAKTSAVVPKDVADPIIAKISEALLLSENHEVMGETILEDVAAINLDIEPMALDEPELGREVGEASRSRAKILLLSPTFSTSSANSSFQGFSGKHGADVRPRPVVPKVKSLRRPLTKTRRSSKSPKPVKTSSSRVPKDSAVATSSSLGSRAKTGLKTKTPEASFDPAAFSSQLLEQIGSLVTSLTERVQNQESLVESLMRSGLPQQQQYVIPDASKLPEFVKSNPWRMALHSPFKDGMLTIEGCGTRPIEDFEFYPPGLQFPFPGFACLTEEALVRLDKVPKETVIYLKEQAQSTWVRTLNEWECVNTMLTPHKSSYTMFVVDEQTPTPCVTKMMDIAYQAINEDKLLPQLRETDLISLLFPGDHECWTNAPATFKAGKLSADCASTQFSERLPRLPESLIRLEFEARTRLSRSINSATMAEMTSLMYEEEPLFKVLTKSLLQTLLSDAYDFLAARRRCRKHVLSEATIRHEPNKLIKAPIWGPDLFPEDLVNNVLSEAARVNQSLKVRWGLVPKRKFEPASNQSRGRKRLRPFQSFQNQQSQQLVQTIPVTQGSQPSTSKGQPQQQYVLVPQSQVATTSYTTSPAFNPNYETQGAFQGYQRARGSGARGTFCNRGSGRTHSRGRGFRGGRGGKSAVNH
ncbi:uncharacterized protein [Palaemon carinicauda]|uniref:uncharacterized protein n=1 Tax=Palaemon carinicauda TaxID=392227 RepID=UPI0035B57E9B